MIAAESDPGPADVILQGYRAMRHEAFSVVSANGVSLIAHVVRTETNGGLELWYSSSPPDAGSEPDRFAVPHDATIPGPGEPGSAGAVAELDLRFRPGSPCSLDDAPETTFSCAAVHGSALQPDLAGRIEAFEDSTLEARLVAEALQDEGSKPDVDRFSQLWRITPPGGHGHALIFGRVRTTRREGPEVCSSHSVGFLLDASMPNAAELARRRGWEAIDSITDVDRDGIDEIVSEQDPNDCSHEFRVEAFDGRAFLGAPTFLGGYGED